MQVSASATSMTWQEVLARKPIRLNLGGCGDCHPRQHYEGMIAVDTRPAPAGGWWIYHDLTKPIPLPDSSVGSIHTEESLQCFELKDIENLLRDCHRLLVPGGRMRIATCDFNHPKDRKHLDPSCPPQKGILTLLRYELMKEILDRSPFKNYTFLHYWKDGTFHEQPIDYRLGYVRRTPEHDRRNTVAGLRGMWRNFRFRLSRGFRVPPEERVFLRGQPYHVTTLVVDCVK